MKLSDIGKKHKTLKNTHVTNGKTLLDLYEPFFERYKDENPMILEIGVLDGASLRTWKEYFEACFIVGFDINPDAINQMEHGIHIVIGDQSNEEDLKQVLPGKNKYDIIIDDGSHVNEYTLKSFKFLWPHLNSGGVYILEDMICSYDRVDLQWPGMDNNKIAMDPNNKRKDIDNFLNEHIHQMDRGEYENNPSEIFAIHVYRNVIIIEKS
jgi:cephalosporin hydroxylase